jgi:hypothetical protein
VTKQLETQTLSVELERAALRAARSTYNDLNETLFGGRLPRCRVEFVEPGARLGCWVTEHRTIELSRALLLEHGWGVLVEVLKHEMAHQYAHEVEHCGLEPAHGPSFRRICAERGIDPKASGIPAEPAAPPNERTRILDRVAKLLALAESKNEHEAQNAMSAAQRLMLKYNIEALLEQVPAEYGFKHLGKPTGRVGEAERRLANILGDHFFVECIWVPMWRPLEGKRGTVLEVCGTPENLELAAYVHSFLMHTAESLWSEYKRENGMDKNAQRRSYLAGVMLGFQDKLRREQKKNQSEGLVWLRDAGLSEFFERRYPRIRRVARTGQRRTRAYAHGREAGQRIVLHRAVSSPAAERAGLLPGRRSG